jgi:hypothetical protein
MQKIRAANLAALISSALKKLLVGFEPLHFTPYQVKVKTMIKLPNVQKAFKWHYRQFRHTIDKVPINKF